MIFFRLFRDASVMWWKGNMTRLGASLAYYTAFAIAPLLLIALAMGGFWFGQDAARHELYGQLNGLLGEQGGAAVQNLVAAAANRPKTGVWATSLAGVVLCVGAMGLFVELQNSLNLIWEVKRPTEGGLWHFVKARLLSFAMVLGIGFLLLVSLVLSSALAMLGKISQDWFPHEQAFWQVLNFFLSLGVITLLFAMMYKVLPDAEINWRDVWVGAFVTAALFNLGKFLIGFYLGRTSAASVYGTAGSFMILLMWVYYSAQILFFGAVFTRLHAEHHATGSSSPEEMAARARKKTDRITISPAKPHDAKASNRR